MSSLRSLQIKKKSLKSKIPLGYLQTFISKKLDALVCILSGQFMLFLQVGH